MAHFNVRASIYPTEDEELVVAAVNRVLLLEGTTIEGDEKGVRVLKGQGGTEGLRMLHAHLRKQRILDSARSVLTSNCGSNTLTFSLHKQAATTGKVSFAVENELYGSIDVLVVCKNPERMVDWLAPPTEDGTPLFELDEPEDDSSTD
ncbi:MAG: RNA-binding domain-containing protein [Methermicoccaceae archaeon]